MSKGVKKIEMDFCNIVNITILQQLRMAQFNPLEQRIIRENGKVIYYSYNGELYAPTFPLEWAQSHKLKTGPTECANCACYGMWNGVFIGYCVNCAGYEYNYERGNGMASFGVEFSNENRKIENSVFETYLKDVDLREIGDKELFDSQARAEEENDLNYDCPDEYGFSNSAYSSSFDQSAGYDSY
jgi:hypothetical protein